MLNKRCIHAFIIIISIIAYSFCFDLNCPDRSQWNKRANETCSPAPEKYHCFSDTNYNTLIEKCIQPDDLPPGFKSVYSGNRNAMECSSERYSPLISWSNDGFECKYKKSLCSEEGQIVYNTGSSTQDTSCRCDYKQGYAFVTVPATKCFCFPSMEDCTCHIKQCPDKSYLLNQDYICLNDLEEPSQVTCSKIYSITEPSSDKLQKGNVTQKLHLTQVLDSKPAVKILFTSGFFLCLLVFGAVYNYCYRDTQLGIVLPQNIVEICLTLNRRLVIILKGRKGTGKTTLASYLTGLYSNILYEKLYITSSHTHVLPTTNKCRKCLIILKIVYPSFSNVEPTVAQVKDLYQCVKNMQNHSILIITCEHLHEELVQFLSSSIKNLKEIIFDLDDQNTFYTFDDKREILDMHLKGREISTKIIPADIDEIVKEYPLYGFPFMCELFCQNVDHITLSVRFFQQPPSLLIREINNIAIDGKSNFYSAFQYCLLVSVVIYKAHLNNFDILLDDIKDIFYKLKYSKLFKSAEFNVLQLQRMILESVNYFLLKNDNEISFVHPAIELAVIISLAQCQPELVVSSCDIMNIFIFLRPQNYKVVTDEAVLFIGETNYKIFAERIAKESMSTSDICFTEKIGRHLSCWTSTYPESTLLDLVERAIRDKYKNKYRNILKFFLTFKNTSFDLNKICQNDVFEFKVPWLYACAKLTNDEDKRCDIISKLSDYSNISGVCKQIMDTSNNSFLHYLVIWNDSEILSQFLTRIATKFYQQQPIEESLDLSVKNAIKWTPLALAGYLGRFQIFWPLANLLVIQHAMQNSITKYFSQSSRDREWEYLKGLLHEGLTKESQKLDDEHTFKYTEELITSKITFGQEHEFAEIMNVMKEIETKTIPKDDVNLFQNNFLRTFISSILTVNKCEDASIQYVGYI